ncbi:MAG: ferritin-like domain-containing protein, partial [Trebonia sp.]
ALREHRRLGSHSRQRAHRARRPEPWLMTATPTPTTAPQPVRPVPALQAALAAEHTAVYGYGIAGALLTGGDQAAAVADWRTHEQARDTLEAMIVKLGATPVAASPAYALPFAVNDARSARRLAAALEDGVTQAYLGLVAVSDTTLRTFGALAMQPPAQRAAAWRGSTVAFPGMGALVSAWGAPCPHIPGPGMPGS